MTSSSSRFPFARLLATVDVDLPVTVGRNYQELFATLPGFTPPADAHSVPSNRSRALTFNVNGASNQGNNTRIDGVSSTNVWLPHVVAYVPALESIEPVNVVTNNFDYFVQPRFVFNRWTIHSKVNWNATDRLQVFGRYSQLDFYQNNDTVLGAQLQGAPGAGGNPCGLGRHVQLLRRSNLHGRVEHRDGWPFRLGPHG